MNGELISPASVPSKDRIPPEENDYFKIAVLHHNILPQYGQGDSGLRKDIFTNNGNFNKYLVKNNFKLVLYGHQHIDNEMYVSVELKTSGHVRPLIENSILALSAPSFLRREVSTEPGFNVIEIDFLPSSRIAALELTKYRYKKTGGFVALPKTIHQLLIPRIDNVGSPKERNIRLQTLRSVIDHLYDPKFHKAEELLQFITESPTNHFHRVKEALDINRKLGKNNFFGMYSLAILPPHTWMQHHRIFLQLFDDNVKRAMARARERHFFLGTNLIFRFSSPVYAAISQSLSNAGTLKIFELAHRTVPDVIDMLGGNAAALAESKAMSLSQWQSKSPEVNTLVVSPSVIVEQYQHEVDNSSFEDSNQEMLSYFPATEGDIYPPEPFELARIVVWPPEFFETDDAREYIRLHEKWLVPLFWLDPARLVSEEGNELRRIGYLLLYARKFKCPSNPGGLGVPESQREPRVFFNNEAGEEILNNKMVLHQPINSYTVGDFATLLRRFDIMLAADAFALARAGKLTECLKLLDMKKLDYII